MNLSKKKIEDNIKFVYLLSLQIAVLFCGAMLSTYLGEYLIEINFFGDKPCEYGSCGAGFLDSKNHIDWGARHYWYVWLCFLLFCCGILKIIIWAINYIEKINKN